MQDKNDQESEKGYLILTRRVSEAIVIGDDINIKVLGIQAIKYG